MKKRLLLLSAKKFDVQFVLAAQNMGYYVITTGNKSDQPAHMYADEYYPANYMDLEQMADVANKLGIDAICQGCTDACAITASYIGEKINIKGHDTLENTMIIHRKDKFKEYIERSDILSPHSKWFDDIEKAYAYVDECDYPVIVKPSDLGGGQGVNVAYNSEAYRHAVKVAFNKSINKKIVVEQFIDGTLHSMTTFLINRKVAVYGTADDYSYLNKYLTNTGSFPAGDHKSTDSILISEVERIATDLELVDGLLHFQYIVDEMGKPWIIEMMRRSPGNRYLAALSDSTGINWVNWIIRAESGESCCDIPAVQQSEKIYGYHSIMCKRNGVFKRCIIDRRIRNSIYQYEEFIEEGTKIEDYLNEKIGSVLFCIPDDVDKNDYICNINQMIDIVMD